MKARNISELRPGTVYWLDDTHECKATFVEWSQDSAWFANIEGNIFYVTEDNGLIGFSNMYDFEEAI